MYLPSIEGWPYVIIALVLMAVAFWELAMAPIRSALPKIIGFIFYSVLAAGLIRTLPYQAQPVPDGPAFIVTAVVGFICFIATMVLIVRCIINKKYSLANAAIVVTLLTPAILTIATYLLSGFGVIEIGPGPDPNTIQL
jgi:CDP-diglyceride synthetase